MMTHEHSEDVDTSGESELGPGDRDDGLQSTALAGDGKASPGSRTATLYRMVLADHTCPFGLRAKAMLEDAGFEIDDRILDTREAVDRFQAEQTVSTTPQIFINGERIGGSDDLALWLNK
jgi:glutaredoxin 3